LKSNSLFDIGNSKYTSNWSDWTWYKRSESSIRPKLKIFVTNLQMLWKM